MKLAEVKDHNFSKMALENQSIVGEEEGAPNQYNKTEAAAQKSKAKFASVDYNVLLDHLVEGREQEAIDYFRTYKPNDVFAFRRGNKNLFHIAIEHGLHDFVSYLLKEHKVLSCIARAARNVSHSVVVNGPDGDSAWAFKTASGNDLLFQFLWNNFYKLLSKNDLIDILNHLVENNRNGAMTSLINSPHFLDKMRTFKQPFRV